jgi:superfamily II DNA or RNA helicase
MKTLPAWTAPLRDWQGRALSAVRTHQTKDFLAMATPAAGKTRFALRVVHEYLAKQAAVRVLVVCPTNHLRTQWSDAAGKIGLQLDPALTNEQAAEAPDYHGAVVTYQQVCLAPEIFLQVCKSKKTLLIFDELHHAGDGKNWGRRCARRSSRRCSD